MTKPLDLLTTSQAAAALGSSKSTVFRLVAAGHLKPALRTGHGSTCVFLFQRRDVERLAAQRRVA